MMLGSCKGPTSFEDIKTVANIQYPTYREACFAMGFLQDDREYVEAIREAKNWGTSNYLRKLFVLILLIDEQKTIYHRIIQAVNNNEGGMFFLYGFRGTGKTFIWRTLASSLRAENQIVIIVASSGIASLLLPGGRTAHSRFKIPVPIFEDSTYKSKSNQIFGGKVIVFGGDFRQILPVIPRGTRSDIVYATINSSYLWDPFDEQETATFAKWILDIGDGIIDDENDGYATIQIPAHLLITQYDDPIGAIVKSTFPDLDQHHNNPEFFKSKAILASTNEMVEQINDYLLSFIPGNYIITYLIVTFSDKNITTEIVILQIIGDHMEYLSSDFIDKSETSENSYFQSITTEFLNSLKTSGLPTHSIKLKIGSPIMLLRNLDQNQGLCNDTRLEVTKMAKHVIAAEIISGKNIGTTVYIPRMSMSPSQSPWPFKLLRRQFLIMLSYAMTINKSQGQSLSMVGLYLPKPVFTHGQLYVALSRANSTKGLKILIHDDEQKSMNSTTNVVYKEVFRNIKS
ncbi:hypothetical protein GYH30_016021 [Glycine max]|uniref:ATP-dependent DNA helicase n=1 Tax=Glycine max TaxID=3847 RepID=A0A0R0JSN0_SOYBN|nr:hypothetical protein GYH30_016021 [Glycine max]